MTPNPSPSPLIFMSFNDLKAMRDEAATLKSLSCWVNSAVNGAAITACSLEALPGKLDQLIEAAQNLRTQAFMHLAEKV